MLSLRCLLLLLLLSFPASQPFWWPRFHRITFKTLVFRFAWISRFFKFLRYYFFVSLVHSELMLKLKNKYKYLFLFSCLFLLITDSPLSTRFTLNFGLVSFGKPRLACSVSSLNLFKHALVLYQHFEFNYCFPKTGREVETSQEQSLPVLKNAPVLIQCQKNNFWSISKLNCGACSQNLLLQVKNKSHPSSLSTSLWSIPFWEGSAVQGSSYNSRTRHLMTLCAVQKFGTLDNC